MVVWLQLSYRQALPLEYQLAQCKAQPSMWIMNQKTKLHNIQVLLGSCQKESGGVKWMMQWDGKVRQCKGHMGLRQLCSSVRATPLNIPKWASCGLYKNSGSSEMRLMGDHDQIWSGMVRRRLVEIGASHQIWWNILREHNWGVPSAHIKFIYYVIYILEYLIVLWGHVHTGTYTIL